MELNVLYLYYDLLNLYGDNGNFRVLCKNLINAGFTIHSEGKSLDNDIDFSEYDIVYIGAGTESNQKIALADLEKYKTALHEYIESDKIIIATGNSFEMFGSSITDGSGKVYSGLGVFDFITTEDSKKRYTSDVIYTTTLFKEKVIGFVNKCSEINGITTPLFSAEFGEGNSPESSFEGLLYKNFYGTHLIGPLLIRNPAFLKFIINKISDLKQFTPMAVDDSLINSQKAYDICLSELQKRTQK